MRSVNVKVVLLSVVVITNSTLIVVLRFNQ